MASSRITLFACRTAASLIARAGSCRVRRATAYARATPLLPKKHGSSASYRRASVMPSATTTRTLFDEKGDVPLTAVGACESMKPEQRPCWAKMFVLRGRREVQGGLVARR